MAPSKFFSLSLLLFISTTMLYQANAQPGGQTTLTFYLQDTVKGSGATVTPIIGLPGRDWTFDQFGTIIAMDDPVTVGPSPLSTQVGRAQGLLVVSAHDGANVNAIISVVFTNAEFSGSTLQIQGVSRQREHYKELSVVSGTGRFGFLRGYATLETVNYDPGTSHSAIRFNVTLRP
ncbi:dirigent protein 11-like [Vigna unguiculata]|uniref:Dirigent protein n=1 Tax=Vigna unguiculata TaxID=3917 RepID=A0A4D6LHX0_VIGUN|nr:dirigent protein 11-like [Vigna unguiculata]QCD87956.1 Plant disease resistance response protein [Vigna unguiculata]